MQTKSGRKIKGKRKRRRKPAGSLSVKIKPKASGDCRTKNRKARR
jgi:hypothetical protein